MAGGMGGCAREDYERDREGARFFDGGRAGAAAGGGRGGFELAGGILCEAGGRVPGAAGTFKPRAGRGWGQVVSSPGRALRDNGYFLFLLLHRTSSLSTSRTHKSHVRC